MTPPAVAFVGCSGSGKTTLLVRVVPILTGCGVKVGVIKHAPRHVNSSGGNKKDSERFWSAGAAHVVLAASDHVVHRWRSESSPLVEEVIGVMASVDLVLVEGYKDSNLPKVEVVRAACCPELLPRLHGRIAVVTDVVGLRSDVPQFPLDQPEAVAAFLMRNFPPRSAASVGEP